MHEVLNNVGKGPTSRRRLVSLFAILALGFLGLGAGSASAQTVTAATSTQTVPVVASISGSVTYGPDTNGMFTISGNGTSSQLGVFNYAGSGQITGQVNTTLTAIADTLTETLDFGRGDTLTLLCLQAAGLIAPNVYHGQDRWTVKSGTGKYKGATGSGTGDTYVDLTLTARGFVKVLSGTITITK